MGSCEPQGAGSLRGRRHGQGRENWTVISSILDCGTFLLFRGIGKINVPAKGLCVHSSDDSEGLQVAVKLKVVDD